MSRQKAPPTPYIDFNNADEVSKRRKLRKSQASLKVVPSYLQKETWERQYLTLKSFNNTLASQNENLKVQNRHLQYQLQKLQKHASNSGQQVRIEKESVSLKGMMGCMRKQLQQLRKQNKKMRRSVRITTKSQMELQIQQILLESQRIRNLLVDEKAINAELKAQQSKYCQQNKKLRHINHKLHLQNTKIKQTKIQIPQKGKNQMPNTKREFTKAKEEQAKVNQKQIKKQQTNKLASQRISKQKNKAVIQCLPCKQLKQQNENLQKQINITKLQNQKMAKQLQKLKGETQQLKTLIEQLNSIKSNKFIQNTIKIGTNQQINKLRTFLIYRYQWLQIPHLQLYSIFDKLLNKDQSQLILISDLLEIIIEQPFSLVFDRYIQILICTLCYDAVKIVNSQILILQNQMISKQLVRSNFTRLIGEYSVSKQDLFMKSAQIITDNKQQFGRLIQGDKTISQQKLHHFMKQRGVQKSCIEYIIRHTVPYSLNLDHLNVDQLFKVLCLPQMQSVHQSNPIDMPITIGVLQSKSIKPQIIDQQSLQGEQQIQDIEFDLKGLQKSQLSRKGPIKHKNNFIQ